MAPAAAAAAAAATEVEVTAWAAKDTSGHLAPFTFSRRATGPGDVKFKVLFCGVCHSDLHQIHNDWGGSQYPMVPGHEIVGEVTEVGSEVKAFKVGEIVGVGCMVNSCQTCDPCTRHLEQYCLKKVIWTYSDKDYDGTPTQGGYSTIMVCKQEFVLKIPTNLPLDAAAPLLCAGITVYSPMKHFQMDVPGKHFGVVGLGGLGHMAVKFGKAFGMTVTVFSTSPAKEKEARAVLGADHFIVSKDPEQMKAAAGSIDYIIDTVSASHPLDPYLSTLKLDGKLVLVGIPEKPLSIHAFSLTAARRFVGGSGVGGIKETQEMLDFCGEHNITCIIEKIPISYINTAMERLGKTDVKYRFVIDIGNSLKSEN
ncbi:hypothetical protein BDL97_13G058200 [Sphagnum fallax]|nr:hypothetical protein BDL97_13G058200 [Sphagnum fallax]